VTNRIYRYGARRLGRVGTNPVPPLLSSERPKPSQGARRRIFEGGEFEQTIAAADEPYRTLFTVAALTGARLSELLGLTWERVQLELLEEAEIEFAFQVDRHGMLSPTKTDGSARTVPIPGQLAQILADHNQRSTEVAPADFVFATRTGRPFGQRNIARALRQAQTMATTPNREPSFPALHARDAQGKPVAVQHGGIPSMHSFRHTVASRALLAGESVDEIAFLLGHCDANVTRAVYVRELSDARRRTMRRIEDGRGVRRRARRHRHRLSRGRPSGVHSRWHDRRMGWPPDIGELLPNSADAYGVQEKLSGYSLNLDHESGGAKAAGFVRILAITLHDLEYLADSLLRGAREVPISEVRDRGANGVLCEVIVPVRGLAERTDRVANVLTSWQIRWEGDPPRLVTAFVTTKIRP
jgi:integrase